MIFICITFVSFVSFVSLLYGIKLGKQKAKEDFEIAISLIGLTFIYEENIECSRYRQQIANAMLDYLEYQDSKKSQNMIRDINKKFLVNIGK